MCVLSFIDSPRLIQSIWAERERRKSRSALQPISVTPASRSVPVPRPFAPRSAPAPSFTATPAPLHPNFGSLRSVFRCAHMLWTNYTDIPSREMCVNAKRPDNRTAYPKTYCLHCEVFSTKLMVFGHILGRWELGCCNTGKVGNKKRLRTHDLKVNIFRSKLSKK